MSYQSRKRYVGRAEKYKRHMRVYRLLGICAVLVFLVWLAFSWRGVYDYLRTYFM